MDLYISGDYISEDRVELLFNFINITRAYVAYILLNYRYVIICLIIFTKLIQSNFNLKVSSPIFNYILILICDI